MSRASRRPVRPQTRTGIARIAVGASALLVAGQLTTTSPAAAAPDPAPAAAFVDLGTATTYSVLGGTGVSSTGAGTALAGDLGLSPAGVIAGFPPGTVAGTVHDKDAAAEQAQTDRQAAYDAAAAQPSTASFSGDQAGTTFKPGVHDSAAAFTNTGTMTLDADGDPSAVFVFQIGAAMSSAAASKVVLTDGALANNVYWQVVGATSLGAGAKYVGTFLAAGAVSLGEGASVKGRILTPGTVALANSPVTEPVDDLTAPVVGIDGGATRSTNDTTPPVSGTTDEPSGTTVTVTVDEQAYTTRVGAAGRWTLSTDLLAAGPHPVLASVTDASRNTGTASQVLTVDVTAPLVAVDGGARSATDDTTPTLSGTTDAPEGTAVAVEVDGQSLTAVAGASGSWSVPAAPLAEASYLVVASADDAAGNTGEARQVLTVDETVPVVSLDGGATRGTSDTSPWVYGRTAEQAGTTVDVTVRDQQLTAVVVRGGAWGVSAEALPRGVHTVTASITDAAGNTGSVDQRLTIGPGLPSGPSGPVEPEDPGTPAADPRPDAAIRLARQAFTGVEVYGPGQRVTQRLSRRAPRATLHVRVTNRGTTADTLAVDATADDRRFPVSYRTGGADVTRAVEAGTWTTGSMEPGGSVTLVVKVRRTRSVRPGAKRAVTVVTASAGSPDVRDAVVARFRG
ncbi:hypothetical protein ENKNEFLB_02004 [Nocardioides aquaticus]|uniref:Bacterial Ig-like domain-containing protein n=1 Tax=Nocardioides aquaticus TaxID=160826 RepID=A0ABX8EJ36_9ACTN|nr:ice-binding family protein [Nocardioides aquaticus]QVT79621.1 hypothetical protein ENKNEFLB_02004 [Nocardioides aquaticus]